MRGAAVDLIGGDNIDADEPWFVQVGSLSWGGAPHEGCASLEWRSQRGSIAILVQRF